MKDGNWVPLSKGYRKNLPHDRAYSKVEAGFSVQCDYDNNKPVTVAGYADLWRWSRKRVSNFLESIGAYIIYPENTVKKQNQKGQIALQIKNRSGTDKEQMRFIDNKDLQEQENRSGTDKEQIRNRSGSTTRKTNTNTLEYITAKKRKLNGKRYETFLLFWDAFGYKRDKAPAADAWLDIPQLTDKIVTQIISAAKIAAKERPELISQGRTPKMAQGWLTAKRWEDEVYTEPQLKKVMRDGTEVPDTPIL